MVKQGDIIRLDFDPQIGLEQRGTRPALVVSNDFFNEKTNMPIVCPITNTNNKFPLHVPLDEHTSTTGAVLCEHIRSMDIRAGNYRVIEKKPNDLLEDVLKEPLIKSFHDTLSDGFSSVGNDACGFNQHFLNIIQLQVKP